MLQYITLEKAVGETPLGCLERWRAAHPEYSRTRLTYAGRLDPMASGTLLILIGDECTRQTEYHALDKHYEFSVLFGLTSDSLDILGRLSPSAAIPPPRGSTQLLSIWVGRPNCRIHDSPRKRSAGGHSTSGPAPASWTRSKFRVVTQRFTHSTTARLVRSPARRSVHQP